MLMLRPLCVIMFGMLLLNGRPAFAESNEERMEECWHQCDESHGRCVVGITAVNDLEISDAKLACDSARKDCHENCNEPNEPVPEQSVPEQPVPEQPVPEQPVPEQPVPEQPVPEQDTINGNIKVYQFN